MNTCYGYVSRSSRKFLFAGHCVRRCPGNEHCVGYTVDIPSSGAFSGQAVRGTRPEVATEVLDWPVQRYK